MKKIISLALALLLLQSGFFFVLSPINIAAQTQEILSNKSIIEMVKSGLSDQVVISMIKSSKSNFDTSSAEVLELKKAGISDAVILEMVQAASKKVDPAINNSATNGDSTQPNTPPKFGLLDGTPVKLRISRTISSADAKVGETVDFEVLEDVKIGDTIVIPRGGVALAAVTVPQPKGRMGNGGKLDINIDSVSLADGEKVALRAVKSTKGGSHTGAMTGAIVATSILFFPAAPFFLFMKGKDINIPKGTEITAYVNSDIPLDPSKFNTVTN